MRARLANEVVGDVLDEALAGVLAEIEASPRGAWAKLLRLRFPNDPSLVKQALIWLHAGRGDDLPGTMPSLGAGGDRFELAVVLDSGATAQVWKAYDRKLGRHVAIKVFHAHASSMIQQSLAEARASSEVISEHVVRVHDVHDADPPYLVLELVGEHEPGGGSLELGASAASCRPRDLAEAVRWVRDVARGVCDAHLHNVFHRDLKPHNVLITPVSRRAKIADFGLAISAATATDTSSSPGLVLRGPSGPARIAGTPEYMAPEQARGLPLSLDARDAACRRTLVAVDVWGLGALAYDLLSGAPPWRAEGGSAAWEIAATGRLPPRLERTAAGEPIAPRLRKIVERALAPVPADRYASASEIADELDAYLARRPTSFDRSAPVRCWLWVRRNPHLTVTAAVALSLATMSLAAYRTVAGLRERSRDLAAEIRQVERDKQALAAKAREERRQLDETELSLRTQTTSLAAVRRTLSDTKVEYQAIVAAKTRELATADAATRQLSEQLTAARSDRDIAEKGRDLYETFWSRARDEAAQATTERDAARRERDAAQTERDQSVKDRDAARAARTQAERARDEAVADRDREASARHRIEVDLSQLAAELSTLRTNRIAPSTVAPVGIAPSTVAPSTGTPPAAAPSGGTATASAPNAAAPNAGAPSKATPSASAANAAAPNAAAPNASTPSKAPPSAAAPNAAPPSASTPSKAPPSAAAPNAAPPNAAAPSASTPSKTPPSAVAPSAVAPNAAPSSGAAPNTAAPSGATPSRVTPAAAAASVPAKPPGAP